MHSRRGGTQARARSRNEWRGNLCSLSLLCFADCFVWDGGTGGGERQRRHCAGDSIRRLPRRYIKSFTNTFQINVLMGAPVPPCLLVTGTMHSKVAGVELNSDRWVDGKEKAKKLNHVLLESTSTLRWMYYV
jgi:hypothetical protein